LRLGRAVDGARAVAGMAAILEDRTLLDYNTRVMKTLYGSSA